ncbi:MAG: UDP-N-acetylmuramoyl-L-alanine--D-glutamate ligase [Bacteroidales bacterium]|nr:UDP-N-acetylmuramoyl-L-alanine--D-glutamate ligase [Bacteroidales bacterium]
MDDSALHTCFDTVVLPAGRVALLGAGREGESSYRLLRRLYPRLPVTVCDRNEKVRQAALWQADPYVDFSTGDGYIKAAAAFPLILKSPGVCLKDWPALLQNPSLTSQADLFLRFFGRQCVGVTGTKGKSTVTHLIHHLLQGEFPCLLAGNMGIPFFDILPQLTAAHRVVCELSSHQLEQVHTPPQVGVLLNLYEEHLDHYVDFEAYQRAKLHIAGGDCLVVNGDDPLIAARLQEWTAGRQACRPLRLAGCGTAAKAATAYADSPQVQVLDRLLWRPEALTAADGTPVFRFDAPHPLIGEHNERNLAAALLAAAQAGGHYGRMLPRVASFQPLPHRLQYVGGYGGAHYFNDSISTIPQACIAAVESVRRLPFVDSVSCLIIGGFDREIDYTPLVDYLCANPIKSIIFVGAAGRRVQAALEACNCLPAHALCTDDYAELVPWAAAHTAPGTACVLSPAAASYDRFRNFEERGEVFMQLVKKQFKI